MAQATERGAKLPAWAKYGLGQHQACWGSLSKAELQASPRARAQGHTAGVTVTGTERKQEGPACLSFLGLLSPSSELQGQKHSQGLPSSEGGLGRSAQFSK